jgi:hypothetical protein
MSDPAEAIVDDRLGIRLCLRLADQRHVRNPAAAIILRQHYRELSRCASD